MQSRSTRATHELLRAHIHKRLTCNSTIIRETLEDETSNCEPASQLASKRRRHGCLNRQSRAQRAQLTVTAAIRNRSEKKLMVRAGAVAQLTQSARTMVRLFIRITSGERASPRVKHTQQQTPTTTRNNSWIEARSQQKRAADASQSNSDPSPISPSNNDNERVTNSQRIMTAACRGRGLRVTGLHCTNNYVT